MATYKPTRAAIEIPAFVDRRTGLITRELPCMRCGYLLLGLGRDGKCPECGAAVEMSLLGNFLEFSDTAWLTKVALGARLLFFNYAVYVAGLPAYFVFTLFARGYDYPNLRAFAFFAAQAFGVVASWFFTAPDPAGFPHSQARRAARWTAIIALAVGVACYFAARFDVPPPWELVLGLASVAMAALRVVALQCELEWLEKLSRRLPADPYDAMGRKARQAQWGLGISLGLCLIAVIFQVLDQSAAEGTLCLLAPAGLAAGVFGILLLRVLWLFGTAVRIARLRSLEFAPLE